MASTHITHLKDYYERVQRFPNRPNALTIGDSWFQYPLRLYPDLQTRLASNARFGRRVNFLDDSSPGRDARDIRTRMRLWRDIAATLADRGRPFALFLVSLGGNDVIGRDFARHLTDGTAADPVRWPWNRRRPAPVRQWLDLGALSDTFDAVAAAHEGILDLRDALAPGATVITHTYAAVTPSNTPYKFLNMRSGPWIWKPLTERGVPARDQQVITDWLLESFAARLQEVATRRARYVVLDTRLELPDPNAWDNEIHPLGPGFIHLADTFWAPAIEDALG